MKINPYLNFQGNTEEAFNFYKSILGGDFIGGMRRFNSTTEGENLSAEDQEKVMHVSLPVGDNTLMATDALEALGQKVVQGNNYYLCIEPDSREQAEEIFKNLSAGGEIEMELEEQFWGDYFGCFIDKFGIQWMIVYDLSKEK